MKPPQLSKSVPQPARRSGRKLSMRARPIGNGILTARISREFAAALEALQLAGPNTDALVALDDAEWQRLLDLCDLANLTLALAQLPSAGFPVWVVDRLQRNATSNALRWKRVQATYIEAAEAFRQARVPHLVIKGFTLAPDYVRDPRLRVQSDIDFYVPPHHINAAVAALRAIGFASTRESTETLADHVPSLIRPEGNWNGNRYDPDRPLALEIHFCLWNGSRSRLPFPETEYFWHHRVQRHFGSFYFWSLSDVDQLGFFALHILRDLFAGDWIVRHVFELASFLHRRANDRNFWTTWRKRHTSALRQTQAVAFHLAHLWFSAQISEEVQQEIAALPVALRRWLETVGGCPLEASFRKTREGRMLQFLMTDLWSTRLHALRHALLPSVFTMPAGPSLRVHNRRFNRKGRDRYYFDRFAFLAHSLAGHLRADAQFLVHAIRYCLSTGAPLAGNRMPHAGEGIGGQYAVDSSGR